MVFRGENSEWMAEGLKIVLDRKRIADGYQTDSKRMAKGLQT